MSSQASPDLAPTEENTDGGPPPGSAEFLASLLIESRDFSCAHTPKLVPGIPSKIPPRLGFFHCTDDDLSYIDTNKLCLDCYNAAVPQGFLCCESEDSDGKEDGESSDDGDENNDEDEGDDEDEIHIRI
ncbi:hypothetical protein PENNAL_c0041G11934 [Penicillium nalgiovense]|uniref:Uncharacterized protein n=1 Tax=Penicillium nalgiovense TaxID=60175 RepID=A0A1V6Y1Z0_PENNA|nr:hypothetical protein PENNAL_c0041G11934 [Penicillium nalgiovense]